MTTTKQVKVISEFVVSFLTRIGADTDLWSSDANMKDFKTLFKTKKLKDKDKPKRASSAYLYFCNEKRSDVKTRLGKDTKITAVTAELGKMWRELKKHDDAEELMAPYQELAATDRVRYQREMEGYVPPTETEIKRRRRRSKDKNKPKRARSAYIFYCADHRAEAASNLDGETAKATEVTTELGRMWREFKKTSSSEEMEKYTQLHEKDKERYITETQAYIPDETKVKTTVPPSRRSVVSAKAVSSKAVSSKAVSSKAVSSKTSAKATAYRLYVKMNRPSVKEEFPQLNARRITSILSKRWGKLSDDEKKEWEKKV